VDVPLEYVLPLCLARGTRVWVRAWASGGGVSPALQATLRAQAVSGTFPSARGNAPVVIGDDRATPGYATDVDPGATANTWGPWTELAASVPRRITRAIVMARIMGTTNNEGYFQFGIGTVGNEVAVSPAILNNAASASAGNSRQQQFTLYMTIPAGSRLVARAQSASTSNPSRDRRLIVYGF
jgi:hypothetical protein